MDGSGDQLPEPGRGRAPGRQRGARIRALPRPVRVAAAVIGPAVLTTLYFTIPFGLLSSGDHVVAWLVLGALLVLFGLGLVATTVRLMNDRPGHPGLLMLLLAWSSILTFAAGYWAMANGHGQFSGLKTRLDALYFTGVTMATVGYGDIHPTGQAARAFVLVQIVYTFSFLAGGVTALGTRLRGHLSRRLNK